MACFNGYTKEKVHLADLMADDHVIHLNHTTSMDTYIVAYGAVVAKNKMMANNGDFVQLDQNINQVSRVMM